MTVELRAMRRGDSEAVLAVYSEGIATGHATFQDHMPGWEQWDSSHLAACRIVAEHAGRVIGWAALSPVSGRCVYGGVAEVSIYLIAPARGRGIGKRLLAALVETSDAAGFWTLQAGVFPENRPSVKLLRQGGFRIVGTREKLGRMSHGPLAGRWRDVLLLERRSPHIL